MRATRRRMGRWNICHTAQATRSTATMKTIRSFGMPTSRQRISPRQPELSPKSAVHHHTVPVTILPWNAYQTRKLPKNAGDTNIQNQHFNNKYIIKIEKKSIIFLFFANNYYLCRS